MKVSGVCLDSVKYFWGNLWARSTRCLTGKLSQYHVKIKSSFKTQNLLSHNDSIFLNPYKHQGAQTSPSPTDLLCCPWCLCRTGNLSQTDPNGRRKRNCSWQVTHYLILGACNQFGIAIDLHRKPDDRMRRLSKVLMTDPTLGGGKSGVWITSCDEARCQDWLIY